VSARPVRLEQAPAPAPPLVAESEVMRDVIERAGIFARAGLPILLVGATGTGKDLLAQHVHRVSQRHGPFVDVNCGALPREMVESLLFGHRRGAFTGAVSDMPGLIGRAASGTLFLDELCSLSGEAQVKLLRVLESGEVRALGETRNVAVDFGLVSAVQEEIGARLERGSFREDLYHRVAGAVLRLPLLRERAGDVLLLAAHFASRHGRVLGQGSAPVLERYSWPGNVRELRSVIGRAAALSPGDTLDAGTLSQSLELGGRSAACFNPASRKAALLAACAANNWEALRICAALGVSRATLYRRLKDEGISLRTSGAHASQPRGHH
jgi:DNA-binding NtrC family response regulator